MGATTALVGTMVGASIASAYQQYRSGKDAKAEAIERNKQIETEQKRELGKMPVQQTTQENMVSKIIKRPSALVKSILTRNQQQKLGD